MLGTAAIASAVLGGMILFVGDAARTDELTGRFKGLGLATGIWLVAWPVWETVKYYGAPAQDHAH